MSAAVIVPAFPTWRAVEDAAVVEALLQGLSAALLAHRDPAWTSGLTRKTGPGHQEWTARFRAKAPVSIPVTASIRLNTWIEGKRWKLDAKRFGAVAQDGAGRRWLMRQWYREEEGSGIMPEGEIPVAAHPHTFNVTFTQGQTERVLPRLSLAIAELDAEPQAMAETAWQRVRLVLPARPA